MEYWVKFQQFAYANEVLMLLGAFLVLIGIIKIVKSSITMLFWLLLAGFGMASAVYGAQKAGYDIPGTRNIELSDLVGPGKELSVDVLQTLCTKLPDTE